LTSFINLATIDLGLAVAIDLKARVRVGTPYTGILSVAITARSRVVADIATHGIKLSVDLVLLILVYVELMLFIKFFHL
jgi:hypothetical protein